MDIKILGICGSPVRGGNVESFLSECLKAAEEAGGSDKVQTELIAMAGKNIKDCLHCNWCVSKQEDGKFCAQKDDMTDIYPLVLKADALLLASPNYIGRLSGYMACLIDRLRAFPFGNFYRTALRNKVGSALAVGWGRNSGIETTLLSMSSAFLLWGMVPVCPTRNLGSPFGAVGLASEHGTGKFDPEDKLGVLKDDFGLKGAQALGKRVVEVARIVKAGKAQLGIT